MKYYEKLWEKLKISVKMTEEYLGGNETDECNHADYEDFEWIYNIFPCCISIIYYKMEYIINIVGVI